MEKIHLWMEDSFGLENESHGFGVGEGREDRRIGLVKVRTNDNVFDSGCRLEKLSECCSVARGPGYGDSKYCLTCE